MTDQHPITPPPELVQQWWTEFERTEPDTDSLVFIATQAARWGADIELEACCEYMLHAPFGMDLNTNRNSLQLRATRRPKPPSLKNQALQELDTIEGFWDTSDFELKSIEIIRRALESLPD